MESLVIMDNMMEERKELMVSPTGGEPTLRRAHFLKPSMGNLSAVPFPSNVIIPEIKEIPFKVQFVGRKNPQKGWKDWVDRLKPSYQHIWKKAGIFEAILGSTYQILKDDELVLKLAEKWCVETNSFLFSWGEVTITLEDMMVLGGYSALGDSVLSPLRDNDLIDVKNKLSRAHGVITQNSGQHARHRSWMKYFMGTGHRLEHEAFLVLWLSRYVLPTYYDSARKIVFPIAIKLSRGISIALAPAVLGSIYRDMRLLKQKLVASTKLDACRSNGSKLMLVAPFQLVQLWAWERFLTLRRQPNSLSFGEPRVARWHKLPKLKVENVGETMDAAGECCFQWRPYVTKLINWDFRYFYRDISGYVLVDSDMGTEVESMVKCLRVSELVGLDCIEQYLPHRVALQFGYDQDLPGCVSRSNETPEIAWSNYNRPVRDAALYTRARLFEGDVTTRYLEWWDQLKSEKGTATKLMLSEIPSNCHEVDEGAYIDNDDDDELRLTKLFGLEDNLTIAEALTPDEDNLKIAELMNQKRARRTQETGANEGHKPLPISENSPFSDGDNDVSNLIKPIPKSIESEKVKLERTVEDADATKARGKGSFNSKENESCKDGGIVRGVESAREFGEMNEQNGALQRPGEVRNKMMKLEHRIRNLEMITADIEAAKIADRSKKTM